jgi:hypothetical protein
MTKLTPEARFWSKVDRRADDECWLWIGRIGPNGYGRARYNGGGLTQAHRIAFEIANGHKPYPFALHHCDNRLCCNPAHLWEGDHADNMRDMVAKGRWSNQYKSGRATLKTHCVHGHEYTPENTCIWSGIRYCRTCSRAKDARRAPARAEQRRAA